MNFFSIMWNLQAYYHLKIDFQKWTDIEEASSYSTATKSTVAKPGGPYIIS